MPDLKDSFYYLPTSERDHQWGLYVLGAGYQCIPPNHQYPPNGHPGSHDFTWQFGRTLEEYQILYITSGAGEFESTPTGLVSVSAGAALVLFPGIWHRYCPSKEKGWDVCWVAFRGEEADRFKKWKFIDPAAALLDPGMDDALLHHFTVLLDHLRSQRIGFQQLIAADVTMILATLLADVRSQKMPDGHSELVSRLKMELEKQVENTPKIDVLAEEMSISPSQLHRLFKEHTGLSPYQYHLQIKIQRAKEMLRGSQLSVKSVALALGFRSIYHFSKLFAKKTGTSPSKWRAAEQNQRRNPEMQY
jgi:AraC-like DNA-binding protein